MEERLRGQAAASAAPLAQYAVANGTACIDQVALDTAEAWRVHGDHKPRSCSFGGFGMAETAAVAEGMQMHHIGFEFGQELLKTGDG